MLSYHHLALLPRQARVLRKRVLPDIAGEQRAAHIWSAGCASGEEPCTMKIAWDEAVARSIPGARLSIVATDIDRAMLDRARRGCFAPTSLRELPQHFVDQAFDREGGLYCIKPRYREGVEFLHQNLRSEAPDRPFDLILCCYLAFTYFAKALQQQVLTHLIDRLGPHGYLAIGTHVQLPIGAITLEPLPGCPQIFTRETVIGS